MRKPLLTAGTIAVAVAAALAVRASPRSIFSDVTHKREHVGQCFLTRVARVETRLGDNEGPVPGSGSQIELADGHVNVSYDQIPAIDHSKVGDPVRLCVSRLPTHCPPGDHRGITYRVKNLRTGGRWTLPDAEHMCGGA
jgi:hypothetical protein